MTDAVGYQYEVEADAVVIGPAASVPADHGSVSGPARDRHPDDRTGERSGARGNRPLRERRRRWRAPAPPPDLTARRCASFCSGRA